MRIGVHPAVTLAALAIVVGCASQPAVASPELVALMARADSQHLGSNFDSALTLWSLVLEQGTESKLSDVKGRALTGLGLAAYRLGNYQDARRHLTSALDVQRRAGLHAQRARAWNALGLVHYQQGQLVAASAFYDSSLVTARAISDTTGIARAVGNLALVRFELGDFAGARAGFETMRDAGARLNDSRMHANALNNLGMLDVRLGNAGNALRQLAEARRLYRASEYRTGEQNNLGQLSTAYAAIGELGRAFVLLDSALALSRELKLRQEEASNLEVLASLHRGAGDLSRALGLYGEAQAINAELGLQLESATNARNRAVLLRELGRVEAAERLVREAMRTHRAADARAEELHDLLLLASFDQQLGRRSDMSATLAKADSLAASLGTSSARAHVALTRARLADRDGDPNAVLRALERGTEEWALTGIAGVAEGFSIRARAKMRLEHIEGAIADGYASLAAADRIRAGLGSTELRARVAAMFATAHSDLVAALIRQGRVEEAFEAADAPRGRALLEHLETNDGGRLSEDAASTLARESLLREISQLMERRLELEATPDVDRAAMLALEKRLVEARSVYEALMARAAPNARPLLGAPSGRTDLDALQSALAADEVVLEYLLAPDRLHLFVVTRERVEHVVRSGRAEDLARAIRLANDVLGDVQRSTSSSTTNAVLSSLYTQLVAPVEQWLPHGHRLVVISHGVVSRAPFSALRDRQGRYLVERHAILEISSGAALHALRTRSVVMTPDSSASVSIFAPLPTMLPGTAREAKAVARMTRSPRTFSGVEASEKKLREVLSRPGIVHVATHGILNQRNPTFSRVDLHARSGAPPDNDGRLEVHELFGQRLSSALVFLSGCETGAAAAISPFQSGEEYAALAQVLLHGGVRNVVATSWRIRDDAAAHLASRFYEHLPGRSPAEALAAAQRDLLRTAQFSHPSLWAAYRVAGDGRAFPPRGSLEVIDR